MNRWGIAAHKFQQDNAEKQKQPTNVNPQKKAIFKLWERNTKYKAYHTQIRRRRRRRITANFMSDSLQPMQPRGQYGGQRADRFRTVIPEFHTR